MRGLSVVLIDDLTSRQLSLCGGLGSPSDGIQRLAQHNSVEAVLPPKQCKISLFWEIKKKITLVIPQQRWFSLEQPFCLMDL